jgi:Ribbon-helix-helix protein, copG family
MRSLRLSTELDERVRHAAEREGASVSEFLRRAASERAERTLADPAERLAYAIGAVEGHGDDLAYDTGEAFGETLEEKHSRRGG